jgi:ABC-type multidrug transport system permease subunit
MIEKYLSATSDAIAEQFKVTFFQTEDTFTNDEQTQKTSAKIDLAYILAYMIVITINLSIMYYAMKFACESGLSLTQFLLAYFFSLPYLIIKFIMTKYKK